MCGKAICRRHGCVHVYEAQLEAEANHCTGISASWCPIHGDCVCPNREDDLSDPACPLHAPNSSHGEDARV